MYVFCPVKPVDILATILGRCPIPVSHHQGVKQLTRILHEATDLLVSAITSRVFHAYTVEQIKEFIGFLC